MDDQELPNTSVPRLNKPRRSMRRAVGAAVLAFALSVVGVFVLPTAAEAAGQCPSGWTQVAVSQDNPEFQLRVMRSPDRLRVVGKINVHNQGAVYVTAWHGNSGLGSAILSSGSVWCSNSSPLPISVYGEGNTYIAQLNYGY